jgi:hypothetical protein
LIYLPVHASWLNQIELYFSIVQRKALTPDDLATLDALAERLLGFAEHYRQIARPFEWTSTRQDLNNLIARIDRHEPQLALAAQPSELTDGSTSSGIGWRSTCSAAAASPPPGGKESPGRLRQGLQQPDQLHSTLGYMSPIELGEEDDNRRESRVITGAHRTGGRQPAASPTRRTQAPRSHSPRPA